MLFMIIEHFEGGHPAPVYRRFRERGRLAPEGLDYLGSWVTSDLTRCYQLMECADRALLDEWIAQWVDLVRFEVVEVMPRPRPPRLWRDDRERSARLSFSRGWLRALSPTSAPRGRRRREIGRAHV